MSNVLIILAKIGESLIGSLQMSLQKTLRKIAKTFRGKVIIYSGSKNILSNRDVCSSSKQLVFSFNLFTYLVPVTRSLAGSL